MIIINQKDFINWMDIKGLSERTKHEYLAYLNKCPYQELNQQDINTFLSVYSNPPAKALLRNLLIYIQTCGKFDKEVKLKAQEIFINIPRQTGRKKKSIPSYLTYEEILRLANGVKKSRDRIIILFLFTTGLRLNEFVNLTYSNFNFKEWLTNPKDTGKCKFIGKGNKESVISIEPEIMALIVKHINESGSRGKSERIFKISKSGLAKMLRLNSIEILGKPIHPHTLRHSYGTFLLSRGLDVIDIKELLRHESLNSTQIYLHINQEELKKKKSEAFNINHSQ